MMTEHRNTSAEPTTQERIEQNIRTRFGVEADADISVLFDKDDRHNNGVVLIDGQAWTWRLGVGGLRLRHRLGGPALFNRDDFKLYRSMSDDQVDLRNTRSRCGIALVAAFMTVLSAISWATGLKGVSITYGSIVCLVLTYLILHASSRIDPECEDELLSSHHP